MKVAVIAPHPDDETLGCGGTLLKHRENGDELHWIIVTGMTEHLSFSPERIAKRNTEIEMVSQQYAFKTVHQLGFPTTQLDHMPMGDIVEKIGNVFREIQPNIVYLPYRGDVHTDHAVVFDAVISCTKWFRYPSINRILAYETLSETEFGLNPDVNGFRPNVFVNIESHLEKKIEIMRTFESEVGEFPFPRSDDAIRALAALRGAAAGCKAAEAFMLLKEIVV